VSDAYSPPQVIHTDGARVGSVIDACMLAGSIPPLPYHIIRWRLGEPFAPDEFWDETTRQWVLDQQHATCFPDREQALRAWETLAAMEALCR
jgi:hypothetical protein